MNGITLVAIDSLTLRMHAAESLSSAGLPVVTAATREEALGALDTHGTPSALVVTEPDLGPNGLVSIVRRVSRNTPVVVLAFPGDLPPNALPDPPVEVIAPSDVEKILADRVRALVSGEDIRSDIPSRARVLAVDDSETFLQRLIEILNNEGYEVLTARSGEEALDVLGATTRSRRLPDAILLDMIMPGLSGDATCRRIKANPVWRALPVIVLTGRDDPEAILEALNAGADDFVAKASDDTILKARLRAQLRRKASEDESRLIRDQLLESELEVARARADRELAQTRERLLSDLERKNQELLREKERAESILESITDAFLAVNSDWSLEYLNGEAKRLLGHETGSPLGQLLWTELPQLAGGDFERRLRTAMSERREMEFEAEIPALGVWFEVRIFPAAEGLSVYFRDVSARRRITENRLMLLEASGKLARTLDFDRLVHLISRMLLGPFAEMCIVHIEGPEYGRKTVLAHVDEETEAWASELAVKSPSPLSIERGVGYAMRTMRPEVLVLDDSLLSKVSPLPKGEELLRRLKIVNLLVLPLASRGKAFGALAFGTGAKGRVYDDEDVAFGLELAGRASLALENARLYRKSQEAVRLRDEFLAIASHELRTPLTALRLLLQSQLRQLHRLGSRPVPASSLLPRLERADNQSVRLGKLVENLLDITRLTANRLVLDYREADLAEIVRDVVERFDTDLRQAGCSLKLQADRPVKGVWDPERLDQVVTNLLTNAIKYGREGTIYIAVSEEGPQAHLSIRDEGIGIAPEDQERIFERFARGVSEQHYGGFGLGLWIVRHLVEAHGGTIWVESERGAGANFHVVLPRRPHGSLQKPPPASELRH